MYDDGIMPNYTYKKLLDSHFSKHKCCDDDEEVSIEYHLV